jgi:hypothetical protein
VDFAIPDIGTGLDGPDALGSPGISESFAKKTKNIDVKYQTLNIFRRKTNLAWMRRKERRNKRMFQCLFCCHTVPKTTDHSIKNKIK